MPVQLDHIRPLDLAQIRPRAPLVNPQQRPQRIERVAMNVERIGQELAERGLLTRLIHRLGIARAEQAIAPVCTVIPLSVLASWWNMHAYFDRRAPSRRPVGHDPA